MACARNYGTEYKKCVMRVKRNLKRAMQANAGKKRGCGWEFARWTVFRDWILLKVTTQARNLNKICFMFDKFGEKTISLATSQITQNTL